MNDVHRASIVTSLSGNWRRFLTCCADRCPVTVMGTSRPHAPAQTTSASSGEAGPCTPSMPSQAAASAASALSVSSSGYE